MTDTNEQKWREEFEALQFKYKNNLERSWNGYADGEIHSRWIMYEAARKKAQEEIDFKDSQLKTREAVLNKEIDKLNKSFLNMFEQNEEKAKRILELENSDRIRFELVMSHGEEIQRLKGIAKEAIDDSLEGRAILILAKKEIQKHDELLDSAKAVMDRCEFGLQPEFYGGKGNGSLKDVRQWLKDYEELKNEQ